MPFDLLSQLGAEFARCADETDVADRDALDRQRHVRPPQIGFRQLLRVVPVFFPQRHGEGADAGTDLGVRHAVAGGVADRFDQASDGLFAQPGAHVADRAVAEFVFLRDQIAAGAGNEHALRIGVGGDVFPERAGEVGRDPKPADARGMTRQRMRGVVADDIERISRLGIREADFAQFLIPEPGAAGEHVPPPRGERGMIVARGITAVAVFIALARIEISLAFAEISQFARRVGQRLFQRLHILHM